MAITKTDWSVSAGGDIRTVTGTTTHSVLEMHRFLMDLLDDTTATGDDYLDVTNEIIPSVRSTDQIITLNAPYNIDASAARRLYAGSFDQAGGNTQYSGLQVVGAVNDTSTQLFIVQNNIVLEDYWGTGLNDDAGNNVLLRVLIKSRDAGSDIDSKKVRVNARELGDTYAEFTTTLGQGESVAAITTLSDDFNQTSAATLDGIGDIVNNHEGYQLIDLGDGSGDHDYYSEWDKGAQSTNTLFEYSKNLIKRGIDVSTQTYGLAGQLYRGITHQITVETPTGEFVEPEPVSWTGGTGQLMAIDNSTAATYMWVQVLTGVIATDALTITGAVSGATNDASGTAITRNLSPNNVFLGSFTGALTGAYGVGVESADLTNLDSLRDLTDTVRTPPNNVTVIVNAVVAGDRLFISETRTNSYTVNGAHTIGDLSIELNESVSVQDPEPGRIVLDSVEHSYLSYSGTTVTLAEPLKNTLSGGETASITSFITDQYWVQQAFEGDASILINTSISTKAPTAGFVRIYDASTLVFTRYAYDSYTGAEFSVDPVEHAGGLDRSYDVSTHVYVPIMDTSADSTSISVTLIYPGSNIPGRLRVYNATDLIVPFEVPITVSSTGSTTQAIRASDA